MKHIILLTDFSETARNAYFYAIEMFKDHKVHFILLNAFDVEFSGSPYIMQIKEELAEESLKGLKKELSLLHKEFPNLHIELVSRFGPLVDVISKEIDELNPFFFVLGCRGESALENFLLGNNAFDVIKNINHPMMVIPKGAEFKIPKKIVFATDLVSIDQNIAKPVYELCRDFGCELSFVNVMTEEYINRLEAEERMATFFPDIRLSFNFLDGDDVCRTICAFTEENNAEMIVLVRHNYSFFERLFHPSITKQMVLHPHFPMIILHAHEKSI